MNVQDAKSRVVARIWQSVAQSGVAVSAIPKDQLDTLVDSIADGVLLAIDEALDETGLPTRQGPTPSTAEGAPASTENVLWEGRPFLSIVTVYQITTERVRIISGLLGKDRDDIELTRVQDLDITQGLTERALNIGDVIIYSADPSTPEATLRNVMNPQQVHEILRRAMLDARKRFRYSIHEEM